MSIEVKVTHALSWNEKTPGEWRWLTFGALCDIADRGRDSGIDKNCFIYFQPEGFADDHKPLRADRVRIDSEGL